MLGCGVLTTADAPLLSPRSCCTSASTSLRAMLSTRRDADINTLVNWSSPAEALAWGCGGAVYDAVSGVVVEGRTDGFLLKDTRGARPPLATTAVRTPFRWARAPLGSACIFSPRKLPLATALLLTCMAAAAGAS